MGGQATTDLQPQAESQSQPTKPKVIYVIGAGRSGSTILGVTLGNCEGIFFAGELDKWLLRSGVPQLEDAKRVRFWSRVRDRVQGGEELFGNAAQRCLERSSAVFRIRDWPLRRQLRERYLRVSESVYRAIIDESGAACVVDTSHYPLRARELAGITGIDLYVLFLVRDPQGVVASLNRSDVPERRFNTPTANAYLWLTYLLCTYVFLRHRPDRRLFVRHEEFVSSPEKVLGRILALVQSEATVPDLGALTTGFGFQGNRLLRSEVLALSDRADRAARRSRLTTLLQLPWAIVFSRLGRDVLLDDRAWATGSRTQRKEAR
jgi:Sulfotransferase family